MGIECGRKTPPLMTYRNDNGVRVFLVTRRRFAVILIYGQNFRLGLKIYARYVASVRIGRRWHTIGR